MANTFQPSVGSIGRTVPGKSRQKKRHPAEIGHSGKNQTGSDKRGKPDKPAFNKDGKERPQQNKRSRRHPDLPLQRPRRPRFFLYRISDLLPRDDPPRHVSDLSESNR